MKWDDSVNGYVTARVAPGEPFVMVVREICETLRRFVLPACQDMPWDHIRLELWADSGRMIFFPSKSTRHERKEKAGCQVILTDLLQQYEELADADRDDAAFEKAVLELEREWVNAFVRDAHGFWEGCMCVRCFNPDGTLILEALV